VVPEAFPDVGCGPQGAFALAVDGAAMYLAGEASGAWRIERRNAVDGTLVWAQSLPGTGSCDAARAVAVDGAFLFAAGRHGGQWRIEKRRLDDGTVVYSHAVASTYESANGIAIDERFVYMAGEIGINGGDSQWRIDRRRLDDGVLVGDVSATTTTVTTPATTTSTAPPGVCAQMRLDDCRIATALRDKPGPSDRFNVRCTVTLDPSSDGIDPAAQGVSFAMTDSNSPPCGTPCFAKAVSPQRIGRCWKYRSPSSSVSGLRSLKLCDFDAPHGIYRLVARSRPVDLQCLDAPPPYLVDLTIGNDCTSQCGSPMSTTTTTVSTTTTTLAGTCVPRTASRHASVITNVRGSRTWANPTNVRVADGIAASVLSLSPGEISDFLFANNLGFALPFYARVTGVMVEVKRSSASGTGVSDSALQLRLGQSERGSWAAPGLWSTTDGYAIYGGPGDLWGGYSWTPEQINSPDFGVALSVQNTTPAAIDTARVDHMRVTVFYVSATGAIGPRSPTVAVDDASIGTRSWATPGNALLADDAEATASGMVGSEQTHYLRVSAFGFGVPAGQTPSGILLEVKRRASFSSSIADNAVRLVRGGLIGTANRNAGYWESESVYQAYGGPDDPWNQTWSAADINSPSFGAAISARHSFNIGSDSALVDHIRLTIVYGAFNTQMTGNPGTAASEQNSEDWSSPGNAALPDLAVARSRLIEGTPSSVLVASAFNFALPPAAQVRGITLTVTRWGRDEDDIDDLAIHDRAIRLVKGGSVGTANRSHPEGWSTVASSIDYGGTADLWGDTWTASDINRADFGAALQAEYRFFAGNNDANVDAMRLTVDYCE
jgi:hypothetical protein